MASLGTKLHRLDRRVLENWQITRCHLLEVAICTLEIRPLVSSEKTCLNEVPIVRVEVWEKL
jgi:hypothetical protein